MTGPRPPKTETQADFMLQASPRPCLGERFDVETLIGSGGMGLVFRCFDRVDGRLVAVKVLQHREHIASERFAREAQVLASLVHPAIVRYVAHGTTLGGEPYLAMEWLDGETLADRLGRGPLGPRATAQLGARVLGALAAAHAHGIVHRDIKPSNLFLPDGDLERAKLLDFGIARRAHASPLTRPGGMVGTPAYMAPEQLRDGTEVDGRADVFGLGCVLCECLTGESPRFTVELDRPARDLDRAHPADAATRVARAVARRARQHARACARGSPG